MLSWPVGVRAVKSPGSELYRRWAVQSPRRLRGVPSPSRGSGLQWCCVPGKPGWVLKWILVPLFGSLLYGISVFFSPVKTELLSSLSLQTQERPIALNKIWCWYFHDNEFEKCNHEKNSSLKSSTVGILGINTILSIHSDQLPVMWAVIHLSLNMSDIWMFIM